MDVNTVLEILQTHHHKVRSYSIIASCCQLKIAGSKKIVKKKKKTSCCEVRHV